MLDKSARGRSFRPVRVSLPDKRAARYVAAARAACAAVTPPCPSGQEEPGRAAVPVASHDARGQRPGGPSGGKMTAAPEAGTIVPARPLTPGPAATTPGATADALVRLSRRHGAPPRPAPPAWPGDPGPTTAVGRRAGPSSGTRGQTSLVPPFEQLLRARMRLGPGLRSPEGPTDRLIHQTAAQAYRQPRTQARIRRFGCLAARPANPRIRVPQEYGLTPTVWQDICSTADMQTRPSGGSLKAKLAV